MNHSQRSQLPFSRTRIAVIGSSGYIGSRLLRYLRDEENGIVVGFDRIFPGKASYEISTRTLRRFEVVIYLGGLTGRVMCNERPKDVEKENVLDIYNLAKRMTISQLLIFASTSAIAEGSGSKLFDENATVQSDLFDSYTASLLRREILLQNLSVTSKTAPQMVGLRFGTVIGLSDSQRIEFAHISLVCQAFLTGRIRVTHPETNRAFLCMEDLVRAITILIKRSDNAKQFDLFHLQSFSASVSNVANAIASRTGVYNDALEHPPEKDSSGFALSTSKFRTRFDFVFEGNQDRVITRLLEDVPRMCLGRESRVDNHSVPCVVCGSRVMHTVIDLHNQPLANDFRNRLDESVKSERFPLRLVRCPKCHHTQLAHIVNRARLFKHYIYQSGTIASVKLYFRWLAEKIIDESEKTNGTVLEVGCNDGSQLDQFSKRGWKTIGIDPAENLAELARKQGHIIYTGFWGVDRFPLLPSPDSLDVVIAQNVIAHVENPVQFLRAFVTRMSVKTKLYIQTSQCEMYQNGQFDTVYHEHVSYFTAHSFGKIADIVGLKIVKFEITPIYGRSCLIAFQRTNSVQVSFNTVFQQEDPQSFALAIEKERKLGATGTWFYVRYQAEAQRVCQWILQQLTTLHHQGHTIVAYGATAEGMVLLHLLLEPPDRIWNILYVIDDAPLKQNTYCPGTSIPVFPSATLQKYNSSQPLAIVILAWHFWEEISEQILTETVKTNLKSILTVLPFPQQKLVKLEQRTNSLLLSENTYKSLPWPSTFFSARRPILLISHFFNEELLLPYWIRHHAPMFDMGILINYNSTDRSEEIIREQAPHTWKIVSTRNAQFHTLEVDAEVNDYERMYPSAWKLALNTPEFIVFPDIRQAFADLERTSDIKAFRLRSILLSGNDSTPLQRFTPLLKQRFIYVCDEGNHGETQYSRFIHRYPFARYGLGRHTLVETPFEWLTVGYLAKFQYTPWPEVMKRKLQIFARIPPEHIQMGWGGPHNVDAEKLIKRRNDDIQRGECDLRDFTTKSEELKMIHRLWREVVDP